MKRMMKFGPLFAAILFAVPAMATELNTESQKLGYIIGMDIGQSLKHQGTDIDLKALFDAIEASYKGEPLAMTPEEAGKVRDAFIAKRRAAAESERKELAAKNAAEGDKFLLANRNKEGVKVTDSGLQYKVIKQGDGPRPSATDRVKVNYRGTLLNGQEFDSSYSRGEPATFALNQVIPGWTEGLQLMPVGSKYMFYIPSNLAYGENGGGPIGPNATLIFQIELLGIEGKGGKDSKDS